MLVYEYQPKQFKLDDKRTMFMILCFLVLSLGKWCFKKKIGQESIHVK